MTLLDIFLYILAGIACGFAGTLLGLGGGFIMVPILNLFFGFEIHQAVGTSLFTIIFTSLSGSSAYLRKRIVDTLLGAAMVPFSILGAVVGANISILIPSNILQTIFGGALIIVSVRMYFGQDRSGLSQSSTASQMRRIKFLSFKRTFVSQDGNTFEYSINIPVVAICGFFAGLTAGLLGVGGGVVQVPIINLVLGAPIHVAIATSIFVIIFTSTFGTMTHILAGNVLLIVGIFLSMGTIIGGQIGARTASKIDQRRLRKILAVVLGFTGIRMFI